MKEFVHQLIQSFRHFLTHIVVGGVLIAAVDGAVRMIELGSFHGDASQWFFVIWWGIGIVVLCAALVAMLWQLVLVVPLLLWRRSKKGSFQDWVADIALGTEGASLVTDVAFLAGVAALLFVGLNAFDWFAIGGDARLIGLTWTRIVAVAVVWILYRVIVWRSPSRAGHRWLLVAITAVAAYELLNTRGTLVAPHHLDFGIPIVFVLAGAAVSLASARAVSGVRWVERAALALVIVASPVPFFYSSDTAAHTELMHKPVLIYPARAVVTGLLELDGDGEAAILGGLDCDDLDAGRNFAMFEIIGNGIDDNCFGGDLTVAPAIREQPMPPTWGAGELAKPPIIVITIDALRADMVHEKLTPTLSGLAKAGFHFERAYGASTHTNESIPAGMSGRYPHTWHRPGVYFGIDPTLAETFGALGYETIGVLAFPWLVPAVVHGLEVVDNSLGVAVFENSSLILSSRTTKLALEHVDARDGKRPLFLWVHYYDPHAPPGTVPASEVAAGNAPSYLTDISAADRGIAQLFEGLDQRGLLDPATIVVFADHGEGLGEHGILTHVWGGYEAVTRVPFIIRSPGIAPGRTSIPVSMVSLVPTIHDLFQIEGALEWEAQSLLPLMKGGPYVAAPFFLEANQGGPLLRVIVDGEWKLIFDVKRQTYQLFNVVEDPDERINHIDSSPQRFAAMRTRLWEWWDRGYNDQLLERKKAAWDARGTWEPRVFVGEESLGWK